MASLNSDGVAHAQQRGVGRIQRSAKRPLSTERAPWRAMVGGSMHRLCELLDRRWRNMNVCMHMITRARRAAVRGQSHGGRDASASNSNVTPGNVDLHLRRAPYQLDERRQCCGPQPADPAS